MGKTPFVSIIIPVRNAERTLDKTFEYLFRAEYPRDRLEIIIADGGSSDNTVKVIRSWQERYSFIKLVEIPNCPSPGYARNKALDKSKGDFILFTDGDCAPCKDWIKELLRPFEQDPKIGIVGGEIYTLRVDPNNLTEVYCENIRFNQVGPRYNFIGEGLFPPLSDMSPSQIAGDRAYFFVTANVAYRREALDGLRFWERPTGEDIELGLKVQKRGWKLYFAPAASVEHMHRATFKALRKVWVTYGQAHGPLIKEYASETFEIIFQFLKGKPRLKIPSRLKGLVYIGNFHLLNLSGLLLLIFLILSLAVPGKGSLESWMWVFAILTGLFALRFTQYCWIMKPKKYFFIWYVMKYMTNLSFLIGGLKGFRKFKVISIEPSF